MKRNCFASRHLPAHRVKIARSDDESSFVRTTIAACDLDCSDAAPSAFSYCWVVAGGVSSG
jgi:hypothetical protein